MDKESIVIFSNHGGFGGSYNLNIAINKYSKKYFSNLITDIQSPYGFGNGLFPKENFQQIDSIINKTKKLFICDYQGLSAVARYLSIKNNRIIKHKIDKKNDINFIFRWLSSYKVVFFWSGTIYMNNCNVINKWVRGLSSCSQTFAMCDLMRCDSRAMPLYQPFNLIPYSGDKFEKFTLCHSPGLKYKYKEGKGGKGTVFIEKAFNQLKKENSNFDFYVLKDLSYDKAIETKSKSHIFVDQIMPNIGGIGKSGLESLMLGVPTMGDVHNCKFEGYYKDCPAINVLNSVDLYNNINILYKDKNKLKDLSLLSSEWGKKLTFENTVNYLENSLSW